MTSASNYSETAPQRAATAHHPELETLPPDLSQARCLLHGTRPGAAQVRVFLQRAALQQIAAHARSDVESEVGGVLLGHTFNHDGHTFVEVKAALPVSTDDHGPMHFTFTADAWAQIHRDRAATYPDLDILGWFHTHPNLGVFFSADDVVVHSAGFVMPWHVGLVVDPLRREANFFGWVEGEIAPLAGFYELTPGTERSILPWRPVPAEVWDETYEEQLARQQRRSPGGTSASLPATPPRLGLLVGALGVLLSLGLLAGGLIPLSRRTDALESIALTLAQEKLATAAAAGLAQCPDPHVRLFTPLAGHPLTPGTVVDVVGTANHPGAARYRLEWRQSEQESWETLHQFGRDVTIGVLTQWDIAALGPGAYQLRLSALDRDRQVLSGACTIDISVQ